MKKTDKNTEEHQKINDYLAEVKRLLPTNPELVGGKQFFEIWEASCAPRPFSFKEKSITIGGRKISLPAKGNHTAHITWEQNSKTPVFIVENKRAEYHFLLSIENGKIRFKKTPPVEIKQKNSLQGEEIEIVYDIIDHFITQKPGLNIFKLTKKEFTTALQTVSNSYDSKIIKRLSGMPVKEIKKRIAQAASDMAIDDLSDQLSLPFGGESYALGAAKKRKPSEHPETSVIFAKSHWQIVQEIELLMNMSRLSYEAEKQFVFPLKNCKIIGKGDHSGIQIKINDVKDIPLAEGSILSVYKRGVKDELGTFIVQIFDYDTLYGELYFDDPEDECHLEKAYIKPRKPPQRFLMQKTTELFSLVKEQPENISGALKYILGLEESTVTRHTSNEGPVNMDFSQLDAWKEAINTDVPITVVQGPPGTGKTWVLVQVIKRLIENGSRILVTAPSNTAVDNICRRIPDLPVIRFGREERVHPEVQKTSWVGSEKNIESYLDKKKKYKNGHIFAATHLVSLLDKTITEDLQENGLFDIVIFDEVGMSRMDEFLLCSQLGKRVVAFGDQQQLPPFPHSASVLKKLAREYHYTTRKIRQIISLSALEWLAQNRNVHLFMLKRSYRCQNPRLLRFSSTLFYHAKVKTSEKAEYFQLSYHKRKEKYPPSTLKFYRTSFLPDETRFEKIIFEKAKTGIENICEAAIVRDVLFHTLPVYPLQQITIISPYKRQVHLIKKLLDYSQVKDRLEAQITEESWQNFLDARIATVDSFQGGESDLVIISYVRSNDGKGVGFVDNPNRINVAHTRCRREIIIIGDLECLKKQAKTDIFVKMERAFARDGEIIDIDKGCLEIPEEG